MGVWQVQEGSFFPHELPVDNHWEVNIQDAVVIYGETQDNSNECVLRLILQRGGIKPEKFCGVIIGEHSCSERSERNKATITHRNEI